MNTIDFHTHLDDRWLDHPMISRQTFLEGLDRCGVRQACIFTIMGLYQNTQEANDRLLEHAQACPERLIPFLTVDPKEGSSATQEVERRLASGLFSGIKFHPWMQAFAPSMVQKTMDHIMHCAAEYNVPILFHDGTPPYSTTLQIAALAKRSPRTTIVLGHGGLADYVPIASQLARDIENLYVCTCGPKAEDIFHLVQLAGNEKVLFGSDYGISGWHILAERLDDVMHAGLNKQQIENVLHKNARNLLALSHS